MRTRPTRRAKWPDDCLGAELLALGRAGHFALLERPEVVVPRIASFLRGLGAAAL